MYIGHKNKFLFSLDSIESIGFLSLRRIIDKKCMNDEMKAISVEWLSFDSQVNKSFHLRVWLWNINSVGSNEHRGSSLFADKV